MKERPNVVLAVVVGLVAVLVVVAAVVSATRTPPVADPKTPEGTVQLFLTAVLADDDEAAVALIHPDLGCTVPLPDRGLGGNRRLSFAVVSSRVYFGDRATVEVDVTEYGTGLFDASSHRESYLLFPSGDRWLVAGNPWPLYTCEK